jgi:hypothetical protein
MGSMNVPASAEKTAEAKRKDTPNSSFLHDKNF